MKSKFLYLVLCAAFIISCATQKSTGVWLNDEKIAGKSFSKLFIVVMSGDVGARSTLETDLAKKAVENGYEVVKSIDVLPPTLDKATTPTKDDIAAKVKQTNCDGVIVASLLKKEEDVRYIPGTTAYSVRPYYSWHGTFGGYYSNWYPTVSSPGYYEKDKLYFMQTNLYDVASQEIMWSAQSKVFNPTSLNNFSNSYTATLVKQLSAAGLLKKRTP
jgi:hypothetical protein